MRMLLLLMVLLRTPMLVVKWYPIATMCVLEVCFAHKDYPANEVSLWESLVNRMSAGVVLAVGALVEGVFAVVVVVVTTPAAERCLHANLPFSAIDFALWTVGVLEIWGVFPVLLVVHIPIEWEMAARRPGGVDACQRCSGCKVPWVSPALVSGAVGPLQCASGLQLMQPHHKCFKTVVEIETLETAGALRC